MHETVTELNNIWKKILEEIKIRINDNKIYVTFLEDSFLYSFDNNTMIVGVNSSLAASIITKQYQDLILSIAKEVTKTSHKIKFVEAESLKKSTQNDNNDAKSDFFSSCVVNSSLTFDNFVVGPSNIEAKQAAVLIATSPGKMYNPLFLYSNSGLGKTHLLHAIVNHIKEISPSKKCLYCTTDDFMVEFIKYVTGQSEQEKLKSFIISHDVFLIDDIQIIGGKIQTELFFFQIFQKMYSLKKQIVITSDKHPNELRGFEDRLKTRFSQGLTMSINPPTTQTCLAILKSKIDYSPLDINSFDPQVLELIAQTFSKSIRNIDEALNKLVFYTTSFKPTKYIDMKTALDALSSLIDAKDTKNKMTGQKIINIVSEYFRLSPSQLCGPSRRGDIALARHIAMYLIRLLLDTPFEKIGLMFGGKDHSTVMSGVKKVEKELKTNLSLQDTISELKKLIKG